MNRLRQLRKCIPDIFAYRTLLYIGANIKRLEMVMKFIKAGYVIHFLEIWPTNAIRLKRNFVNVIEGDVRSIEKLELEEKYDVVMWWHGPEHVKKEEIAPTLEKLIEKAEKIVIIACPYGKYEQGKIRGNPYERHLSTLNSMFFRMLGWKTNVVERVAGKSNSNLLAWHRKEA